jgi:choline-sulfatase
VKQQARGIDLLPTLLELTGGKATKGLPGTSLTPAFQGKAISTAWSYEETLYPKINMGWAELRGIRTNDWKYIRAPKPELYDLIRDPAETTNVIGSHPKEVQQFEAKLKAVNSGGPENITTSTVNQRTLAQLKSLGYLGGSSARGYALTGKGIDPKDRIAVLKLLYLAVSPDARTPSSQHVALLVRALAEDPANPTVTYHLGDEYRKSGRRAEEMKLYRDGIVQGLRNGWLFSRLGFLYLQQGNKDEAIAEYEKAAQVNPSDVESLTDLGMAYFESGRLADAERVFQWSLATDDKFAPAYNGLGMISIQKQDFGAARDRFEKAVQFDPDLLEAQLNLGRVSKIMGFNAQARKCFEAFLAKAPQAEYGPIIAKLKEELAGMP